MDVFSYHVIECVKFISTVLPARRTEVTLRCNLLSPIFIRAVNGMDVLLLNWETIDGVTRVRNEKIKLLNKRNHIGWVF